MTQNTQDKLKKFVQEHRGEFDVLTPKDTLWSGINKQLEVSPKGNSMLVFWKVAAIILFVFSIGLIFYVNKESILSSNENFVDNSEFINTENYYSSIINERQEFIKSVALAYPEVEMDFVSDWKTLDAKYEQLKNEYKRNVNEEVLNALVQNLQLRVNLLNKQIEILKQIDTENKSVINI